MRNKDEQESGELRVVDKRRFTSEGDTREETPTARVDASSAREHQTSQRSSAQPGPSVARAQSAEAGAGSLPPVDFSSFVVSLATQALVMLGEIPDPESDKRVFNREAAQHTIDIISMLEEKSHGNLSADELNLMNEILTSLRLAFVKKVKEHDYSKTSA